ncbi:hypothetical protein D3C71_1587090 [compost metagenome]
MILFGLTPGRTVGQLKNLIREAILEGEIPNSRIEAYQYLVKKAIGMGLEVKQEIQLEISNS